jgi:hypothetical protein
MLRLMSRLFATVSLASCSLLMGIFPPGAQAAPCPPAKTINYLAPFEKMPSVQDVPSTGKLSFGPRGLRLVSAGGLLAGGGRAGFTLESVAPNAKYRLGWRLELKTTRINKSGQLGHVVRTKAIELNDRRSLWDHPVDLSSHLDSAPSYYRLDLAVYDHERRTLGKVGEYVRVVSRRRRARLEISPEATAPGGLVYVRVLNLGTTALAYGTPITLEHLTSDGWHIPPGPERFWSAIGLELSAGGAGKCEQFLLQNELEPGLYRLSKEVSLFRAERVIHAQFEVE